MDIKDAISHYNYGISHDIFSEPVTSYARLAIIALEKQIPEKVKDGSCPNCHRIFFFHHGEKRKGDYCDNCGKALFWED